MKLPLALLACALPLTASGAYLQFSGIPASPVYANNPLTLGLWLVNSESTIGYDVTLPPSPFTLTGRDVMGAAYPDVLSPSLTGDIGAVVDDPHHPAPAGTSFCGWFTFQVGAVAPGNYTLATDAGLWADVTFGDNVLLPASATLSIGDATAPEPGAPVALVAVVAAWGLRRGRREASREAVR